jgi:hypothetical protein
MNRSCSSEVASSPEDIHDSLLPPLGAENSAIFLPARAGAGGAGDFTEDAFAKRSRSTVSDTLRAGVVGVFGDAGNPFAACATAVAADFAEAELPLRVRRSPIPFIIMVESMSVARATKGFILEIKLRFLPSVRTKHFERVT